MHHFKYYVWIVITLSTPTQVHFNGIYFKCVTSKWLSIMLQWDKWTTDTGKDMVNVLCCSLWKNAVYHSFRILSLGWWGFMMRRQRGVGQVKVVVVMDSERRDCEMSWGDGPDIACGSGSTLCICLKSELDIKLSLLYLYLL